jgi:hypothetical protein
MFGSQVLEVVIGLTLIYLVLSIACSGLKEVIASVFSLRSRTLENGVRNMLKNGSTDFTAKLFAHPLIAGTAPEGQKPSYIASRMFAAALLDVVAPADPNQPRTMASLRAGVLQIPDTKLRTTLLNILDNAGGDVESARLKVAHWFDDTMARVGGWYKRMAQTIIFFVGLALCCALNADSMMVTRELWTDQAIGRAMVVHAEKTVQAVTPADSGQTTTLEDVANEVRAANTPPIGWVSDPSGKDIRCFPQGAWLITLKFLGILLTSFAILLGAPFWFDLLNNIMNLRISGTPPKPSE